MQNKAEVLAKLLDPKTTSDAFKKALVATEYERTTQKPFKVMRYRGPDEYDNDEYGHQWEEEEMRDVTSTHTHLTGEELSQIYENIVDQYLASPSEEKKLELKRKMVAIRDWSGMLNHAHAYLKTVDKILAHMDPTAADLQSKVRDLHEITHVCEVRLEGGQKVEYRYIYEPKITDAALHSSVVNKIINLSPQNLLKFAPDANLSTIHNAVATLQRHEQKSERQEQKSEQNPEQEKMNTRMVDIIQGGLRSVSAAYGKASLITHPGRDKKNDKFILAINSIKTMEDVTRVIKDNIISDRFLDHSLSTLLLDLLIKNPVLAYHVTGHSIGHRVNGEDVLLTELPNTEKGRRKCLESIGLLTPKQKSGVSLWFHPEPKQPDKEKKDKDTGKQPRPGSTEDFS